MGRLLLVVLAIVTILAILDTKVSNYQPEENAIQVKQ